MEVNNIERLKQILFPFIVLLNADTFFLISFLLYFLFSAIRAKIPAVSTFYIELIPFHKRSQWMWNNSGKQNVEWHKCINIKWTIIICNHWSAMVYSDENDFVFFLLFTSFLSSFPASLCSVILSCVLYKITFMMITRRYWNSSMELAHRKSHNERENPYLSTQN